MYPTHTWYLWQPWLGWEYFANPGIAFGIPIPNVVLIIVTPFLLLWLATHWQRQRLHSIAFLGIILIVAGALSNFIDRLLYAFTIDYLRVFTAIVNLADIMILSGMLLLIFFPPRRSVKEPPLYVHTDPLGNDPRR